MGGGVVQGAAFDLLFTSVLDGTQKVDLNRLKSTLSSIKLAIDDIQKFNEILERPQYETEAFTLPLIEGEKLIKKCSKVKWNVFMRLYYSKKLSKLEALLLNFFQINVAALHFRETKRISVLVSNLEEKMNKINAMLETSEINGKYMSSVSLSEILAGLERSDQGNEGCCLRMAEINLVEIKVAKILFYMAKIKLVEITVAKILV